jgi:hypothetical protein
MFPLVALSAHPLSSRYLLLCASLSAEQKVGNFAKSLKRMGSGACQVGLSASADHDEPVSLDCGMEMSSRKSAARPPASTAQRIRDARAAEEALRESAGSIGGCSAGGSERSRACLASSSHCSSSSGDKAGGEIFDEEGDEGAGGQDSMAARLLGEQKAADCTSSALGTRPRGTSRV